MNDIKDFFDNAEYDLRKIKVDSAPILKKFNKFLSQVPKGRLTTKSNSEALPTLNSHKNLILQKLSSIENKIAKNKYPDNYSYQPENGVLIFTNHKVAINFSTKRKTQYSKKLFEVLLKNLRVNGYSQGIFTVSSISKSNIKMGLLSKKVSKELVDNDDWVRHLISSLRIKLSQFDEYIDLSRYSPNSNSYIFKIRVD